jgi:hypothetical protein
MTKNNLMIKNVFKSIYIDNEELKVDDEQTYINCEWRVSEERERERSVIIHSRHNIPPNSSTTERENATRTSNNTIIDRRFHT